MKAIISKISQIFISLLLISCAQSYSMQDNASRVAQTTRQSPKQICLICDQQSQNHEINICSNAHKMHKNCLYSWATCNMSLNKWPKCPLCKTEIAQETLESVGCSASWCKYIRNNFWFKFDNAIDFVFDHSFAGLAAISILYYKYFNN